MSFTTAPEKATFTSSLMEGSLTQNLASINNAPVKHNDQPVLIPYDVAAVAGSNRTLFCESGIPDYWVVSVMPTAAVKVLIFLSASSSGIPIRLGGGGYARLPGLSEYLTVVGDATCAAVNVSVIAVRGYKHVEVDGGNLA